MARKTFIAGNWKMNKTAAETKALAEALKESLAKFGDTVTMAVCPTFTSLAAAVEVLKGSNVKVGAQNIHWADNGAFTGEISGAMLKEIGVEYVIIGHSERRGYFHETDEDINKKAKAIFKNNLLPIICCGESLAQREAGQTEDWVASQIEAALAGLSADQVKVSVLAYEPIWAIGTGKTATADQAQEVVAHIRATVEKLYNKDTADAVRILYGGSVKPANVKELMAKPDIDGGLVGGASMDPESFIALANYQD